MSLPGETRVAAERLAGISLALTLGLGTAACGGDHQPDGYPSPIPAFTSGPPLPPCGSTLEAFSIEKVTSAGDATLVNDGFCVNVYGNEDEELLPNPIGQIPTDRHFGVDCYDTTRKVFVLTADEKQAMMNLSAYALQLLNDDPVARELSNC